MLNPEIILISIVILIQFFVFYKTAAEISILKNIFPKTNPQLSELAISNDEIKSISEQELSTRINNQNNTPPETESDENEYGDSSAFDEAASTNIDVIKPSGNLSPIFKKIISSTNIYLVKNKNHAADFGIIKEIAEREIEAQDNQVDTTVSLPLYLGLLGTILGIIIGLYTLYPSSGEFGTQELIANIENEIPKLLGSVAIAMVASFIGLALTIYGNGALYKSGIKECDRGKNTYFTFIQTELLPILSRETKSNLNELKSTLQSFNEIITQTIKTEFSENVKLLNTGIHNLNSAINEIKQIQGLQYQSISELNKVDFETLAKMFGDIRIGGIELNKGFEHQKELLKYIYDTLEQIKEKELQTRSFVAELDNTFKKAAEALSDSAKYETIVFKSFLTEEKNLLQKALENNRPQFDQLQYLEKISEQLSTIKALDELNNQFKKNNDTILKSHVELLHQIRSNNEALIQAIGNIKIQSANRSPFKFKDLFTRIKKVFVK